MVVTHNSADVIASCLAALPAALQGVAPVGVVVVDNASSDDTAQLARQASPAVRVVPAGGNVGYAAAINIGVRAAADHDLLLVLNPDVQLAPGCVSLLAQALQTGRRGIAVPRLQHPDGRLASSLRREPSLRTVLAEAVLGGRRAARLGWGEVIAEPAPYASAGAAAWATGAAMLVRSDCARAIGDWDESFLLYSEETDYMLRARDAGYLTWYVPEAVGTHRGGDSSTSPFLWSLLMTNRVRLIAKRRGRATAFVYRMILLAGESVRALAGRRRSRAAVSLLLFPSRRPASLP